MSRGPSLEQSLEEQTLLLAALIARFEQREERMRTASDQFEAQARQSIGLVRDEMTMLVDDAGERIGRASQEVLTSALAGHARELASAVKSLSSAARSARLVASVLLAVLTAIALLAWGVLAHYRGELATARGQLQQHQQADAILRAYAASDIALCGASLCANVDPDQRHQGDYRVVRPRPSQ